MDKIIIENLNLYAHHGVYQEETEKGQNFYLHVVLETDTRKAGLLDDLELSTDYGEVCQFLHQFLTEHTYKLLEAAAENAAEAVLLQYPLIRQITLEIRKPEAPIPLPFDSVSVKITRGWHKAYLSCGSNMGDKKAYLEAAGKALQADEKCRLLQVSDWMETTPYGGVKQNDFLNGAMEIETLYTPEELLLFLHEIEAQNGRERVVHWGERTLDLDILFYEDCVMATKELTIPHKDMANRDFVLAPLSQIAPYAMHPVYHKSVLQLYEEVKKHGEVHVKK